MKTFRAGTRTAMTRACCVFVGVSLSAVSAFGADFEVTPLIGARWGGEIKVQQGTLGNHRVDLANSGTYGVAAGFRFDGNDCQSCDLAEFRWMRQDTHLDLSPNPAVRLDHFLGDLTHEFSIKESKDRVKPFVNITLGAARMSTPVESRTRFVFGIGGGVKVFPHPRWGFKFQMEYLPMVMHAEVQKVICVGGCVVTVNGGVMNQIGINFGPVFRF